MTYLERHTKIKEKMSISRIGNAECELDYNALIFDMQNAIDLHKEHIDRLEEELRRLREIKYLRDSYGD